MQPSISVTPAEQALPVDSSFDREVRLWLSGRPWWLDAAEELYDPALAVVHATFARWSEPVSNPQTEEEDPS